MFDKASYTIGWICALKVELVAARAFLDAEHDAEEYEQPVGDDNCYVFGNINKHNIVVAALPHGEYGTSSAATVARDLVRSFPSIKATLMVGIGGGAPRLPQHDIRLGDVVVSSPSNGTGGVIQYDFGKALPDFTFQQTGHLNSPPKYLLAAVTKLAADWEVEGHEIEQQVREKIDKNRRLKSYGRPALDTDILFLSAYEHQQGLECGQACITDASQIINRPPREDDALDPEIHYGMIASGNTLVRDAQIRDALAEKHNILCVEMEAAGLMNNLPVLVIRGICDYADSHKNKLWQGYAAMTAAAYARSLLLVIRPANVEAQKPLSQTQGLLEQWTTMASLTAAARQAKLKEIADTKKLDMEQWLAAPDHTLNYRENIQQHGAGQSSRGPASLCDSSPFGRWRQGHYTFLHVTGPEGCGKTMLASLAIQELQVSRNILLYWYFDVRDPRKRSLLAMYRSLLLQAYQLCDAVRPLLDTRCAEAKQSQEDSTEETAFELLASALTAMSRVPMFRGPISIVVDAINESLAETPATVALLQISAKFNNVKMVVFTTAQWDVSSIVGAYSWDLRDSQSMIDGDIKIYLDCKLHEARPDGDVDRDKIVQACTASAMTRSVSRSLHQDSSNSISFREVVCRLNLFLEHPGESAIEKDAHSMHLQQVYLSILDTIPSEIQEKCSDLLALVFASQRPMRLYELEEALWGASSNIAKNNTDRTNRVLSACSSLLTVVRSPRASDIEKTEPSATVMLAHSSVYHFLVESMKMSKAHAVAATICLRSLLDGHIQNGHSSWQSYAARYWPFHVNRAGAEITSLQPSILCLLDDFQPLFDQYLALAGLDNSMTPLEVAAELGLVDASRSLLASTTGIPSPDIIIKALRLACTCGHKDVVSVFIDMQAEVVLHSNDLDAILHHTARSSHWNVVFMLLDRGASINARDAEGRTLLFAAKALDSATKLLARGIDVNARDYGRCLTILHHVCETSVDDGMVAQLLDAGARTDIADSFGDLPLHSAANEVKHSENTKVLELLLKHPGTLVNAQNEQGKAALHLAVARSTEHRAEILLNHGADPSLRDCNGQTPIFFARNRPVVHSLCRKGADPSTRDNEGFTMVDRNIQRRKQTDRERLKKAYAGQA